jgi:hypothetical protein
MDSDQNCADVEGTTTHRRRHRRPAIHELDLDVQAGIQIVPFVLGVIEPLRGI